MKDSLITFIGAGNMAKSLISGLIKQNYRQLQASSPNAKTRLKETPSLRLFSDNAQAASGAGVVLLAVKPNVITSVCRDIKTVLSPTTLVISVAAGTTLSQLADELPNLQPIIRCMPNIPVQVGYGACVLCANNACETTHKHLASDILSTVGNTYWIENEQLMDTVTALSGSGPAYFLYVMEALVEAAIDTGLDKELANNLTIQTALGTAMLANKKTCDLKKLREQVTSKGGTTEAGIHALEKNHIAESFKKAIIAAKTKATLLSQNA